MKLSILLLSLLLITCFSKTEQNDIEAESVKGYLLTHTISPALGPGNADFKRSDTVKTEIYMWKNQNLFKSYRLNYKMDQWKYVTSITAEEYAVTYEKESRFGYFYDLYRNEPVQKINIDSFFKHEWYGNIKISSIFSDSDFELLNKQDSLNIHIETYKLQGKGTETSKTGQIDLIYTKGLPRFAYSLSKELDSISGYRLTEVKIVNNPRELTAEMSIPKVVVGYKISEIKNPDKSGILKHFKGYKN